LLVASFFSVGFCRLCTVVSGRGEISTLKRKDSHLEMIE
jgi:hypothetical protein